MTIPPDVPPYDALAPCTLCQFNRQFHVDGNVIGHQFTGEDKSCWRCRHTITSGSICSAAGCLCKQHRPATLVSAEEWREVALAEADEVVRLNSQIAALESKLREAQQANEDHAECIGELEYANENAELRAKLREAEARAQVIEAAADALLVRLDIDQQPSGDTWLGIGLPFETIVAIEELRRTLQPQEKSS